MIVSVLVALGYTTSRGQVTQFRLMQSARLLHSDIQGLRSMAIATNRQTRLVLLEADAALDPYEAQQGEWLCQVGNRSSASTEWDTLPINKGEVVDDTQGERSLAEDGANESKGISLAPWPPLTGPGTGNADAIVFSPRGWVDNPASDFTDGYIVLELVNKLGVDDGGDKRVAVRLSRGGLVRLETSEANTVASGSVGTGNP